MLPEWENATSTQRPVVSFTTRGRRIPHGDSYIIVDQAYVQYIPPTPPPPTTSKFSSTSAWGGAASSPPPPSFFDSPPPAPTFTQAPWQTSPARAPKRPILFIHGGGLTSAVWESTPDRRPGWALRASQAGHPVYLLDGIESGRSARAPVPAPLSDADAAASHRTARHVWERFRLGPFGSWDARAVFDDGQFPAQHLDRFLAMQCDRRVGEDEREMRGLMDAVLEIGECDVVAHSHGALLLIRVLAGEREVKGLVGRVVLVEPGTPVPERREVAGLWGLGERVTVVWGDHLDTHGLWTMFVKEWEGVLKDVEVLRLSETGIRGNSHLPMCDRNSDEVFELLLQRLS